MIHELKLRQPWYGFVEAGIKTFEIRKNDRVYNVGDYVALNEWDPDSGYSGRKIMACICYVTDYDQKPGVVVFGFVPVP